MGKFDHSTAHRNCISTQQKTALWKCTDSECYLFSLTLFSSLILQSVNLEKHNTPKADIDFFNCCVFYEIQAFSST